ncbi:GNAT family N-acetyltransferase [Streptomyces sp. NPDC052396]|uniref:GNAT family N-acetyltransferase n=1 Tax=Streptomyces sp. NPDC052396 TaxID=3365689 RepID=UPI0037D962D5
MSNASTGPTMRPYAEADQPAVLELVNHDRLQGQPVASVEMLNEALAGHSQVDAGWWQSLSRLHTDVAVDPTGHVVGVVSYATSTKDQTGHILWLHCHEDQALAARLISHACTRLGPRTICAFDFASALSLGLEALPVRHRPATRTALEQAGFVGENLWRYMHTPLPISHLPQARNVRLRPGESAATKRLQIRRHFRKAAEAVIGLPVDGTGVLWWISVTPSARGRGIGRLMLGTALHALTELGANQAILYVDDDEPPGGERDRTAANRLYDSAGFHEVDRLYAYRRKQVPTDPVSNDGSQSGS